jgi:chromosome segregation ATPase
MNKIPVEAEVERLKAQVEALLRAREAISEQIAALSERIGELRSSLVEHERASSKLESEIKATIELVNKIKPEEVLKEVSKFDAKIEAVKARIDSYETLADRIIEEIKELRRTFVKFKSLDAVSKLAEDFKKDLEKAKRVESEMSKHASKVEAMFNDMQKKYKEYADLSKITGEIKERFRVFVREFDKLRVEFAGVARKEDLRKFEEKLDFGLKEARELSEELKKRRDELKEIILSSKKMAEVSERVTSLIEEKKAIEEKLKLLEQLVDSFTKLKLDVEKLDNRLVILEEFKNRAVSKNEISMLKKKIDQRILDFDKIAGEIKSRIDEWDEKMKNVFKATKAVVEFSKRVKNYEKALRKFEERQETLVKLIEAAI